jgi:hypothetical protein
MLGGRLDSRQLGEEPPKHESAHRLTPDGSAPLGPDSGPVGN